MTTPESSDPLNRTVAVITGKGGAGKCLVGSTEITDPLLGLPVTVKDAVGQRLSHVFAVQADGVIRSTAVGSWISCGTRPVLRLDLASGRSVTVTPHHPMLLPEGWRSAETIQVGETVASAGRVPGPIEPRRLPDGELDLLAVMLAEGNTSQPQTGFSTQDPQVLELATVGAASLGARVTDGGTQLDYTVTHPAPSPRLQPGRCRCGCGETLQSPKVNYTSAAAQRAHPRRYLAGHGTRPVTRLVDFRLDHGLDFVLAKNKTAPEALYRLPLDQLARFLSVFWMCDGHVTTLGSPQLVLASESLVRAIQHLLLRLGVQSSVAYKKASHQGKSFDAWRLNVYADSIPSFAAQIPLWDHKAERLQRRVARAAAGGGNPNVGSPSLSPEMWERIRAYAPTAGKRPVGEPALRQVAERLGWAFGGRVPLRELLTNRSSNGRRYVSRRALRAYLEVLGGPSGWAELGHLVSDELHWDRVVAVTPAGRQEVYDLAVPGPANFIANDLVVHNTSITANTAGQLADAGYRMLAVDLDLSGNLKLDLGYVGHDADDEGRNLVDALWHDQPLRVIPGVRHGLDVLPGGRHLEMLTALSYTPMALELPGGGIGQAFAAKLAQLVTEQDYDLVLLDGAPGNPVLQDLALAAARYVLIPTKTDAAGWDGLRMVGPRVRKARDHNPALSYLGVVLFAHQPSATRVLDATRAQLAEIGDTLPLLSTSIRHSEAAAHDCRSRGQLAHELARDVSSNAAQRLQALRARRKRADNVIALPRALSTSADSLAGDYRRLAREVLTLIAAAEQSSAHETGARR